jgi:acetyltransferase
MVRYQRLISRRPGRVPDYGVQKAVVEKLLRGRQGWLSAADAEAVLTAYGFPFAASRRVKTIGDAVTAAHELGLPVVLKGEAPELLHKSDHHAVVVNLQTGDEVYAAAEAMLKRLKKFKGLELQVQRQAGGHREVLLGMTRDARYGPLFALGLGGTLVEVLRDVAVRVAPLDHKHPGEMLASLKGAALLGAYRGDPAVRVDVVEEALLRLQQLVDDFPAIQEVEVNPFILAARGIPSVAVDARLRVATSVDSAAGRR